ncbi:SDR family oxidoreductase [Mycolicibacterium austroafricanum]|uniref:SDR family oxidoreductase n=1 Tax=Mycolicibacterium austroafricanum TaxID=39687 RepID=UPI001CA32E35|nr:SDR family NAD(P)-dependent oxidoreductase [Mycolicibacterium austroafricanum]QZT62525.1 SDR family NAD(P)-dependent oxidoreductase [Mycolicibacterium austroafricanum]
MKLSGRVALVTGGGSGIGAATAKRLVAEGMRVCVADVDADASSTVAEAVGGLALVCDVSDPDQVADTFSRCVDEFGSVDLAVLNAGITIRWSGDIGSLNLADYRKSLGVNLDGVVFGAAEAVRAMRARTDPTDGAIVATASLSGLMPWYPDPVYSLGKHGVVGFMRSVAPSLAAEGIAVHTVCPGITATGALGDRRALVEGIGVPVMEPEVIADTIVTAATSPIADSGTCWVAQYGKPPYHMVFPDLSGPDDPLNVPVTRR